MRYRWWYGFVVSPSFGAIALAAWRLITGDWPGDLGSLATGAGGGLVAAAAAVMPLYLRYRRDIRESRVDHRATFRERNEVNQFIMELAADGPHLPDSEALIALAGAIEHRMYLTSLLAGDNVLRPVLDDPTMRRMLATSAAQRAAGRRYEPIPPETFAAMTARGSATTAAGEASPDDPSSTE